MVSSSLTDHETGALRGLAIVCWRRTDRIHALGILLHRRPKRRVLFHQPIRVAFIQLAQERHQRKKLVFIHGFKACGSAFTTHSDGEWIVILARLAQDFINGLQRQLGRHALTIADYQGGEVATAEQFLLFVVVRAVTGHRGSHHGLFFGIHLRRQSFKQKSRGTIRKLSQGCNLLHQVYRAVKLLFVRVALNDGSRCHLARVLIGLRKALLNVRLRQRKHGAENVDLHLALHVVIILNRQRCGKRVLQQAACFLRVRCCKSAGNLQQGIAAHRSVQAPGLAFRDFKGLAGENLVRSQLGWLG